MSAEKELYDCSFVSIHYIICECGETFPSENGLRAHLEKEHPHKRERKEFKCGVCGLTFDTEDACIQHYEDNHIAEETLIADDYISDGHVSEGNIPEHGTEEQIETYYTDHVDNNVTDHVVDNNITDHVVVNNTDQVVDNNNGNFEFNPNVKQEEISDDETKAATLQITTVTSEPQNVVTMVPKVETSKKVEVQALHIPEEYEQMMQVSGGQLVLLVSNTGTRKKREKKQTDGDKKPVRRKKNIKDRVCEVCGKNYSSNAALRYHQRVHTGERPFQCHLCPKAFTMPLFLQIHVRTHTGERPYQCPLCPKAFSNKAALLRHDRVHTGEKPYACPMCYKTFTQSNSMKLHVTTVHLKQPAPYKSKSRRLKEKQNKEAMASSEGEPKKRRKQNREGTNQYESITIKLDPRGYPSSTDGEGDEENNFEVVESEEVVIPDNEEECYEIVYDET